MPKTKPSSASQSRSQVARDDNSDEEAGAHSQSLTQAEKAISSLSEEEVEKKVAELVRYILIMDQRKIPIKRNEINKNVLKDHSRGFVQFMHKAKQRLQQVFGMELVEISEENKQKTYCLINNIELDPDYPHLEWPPENHARLGLVTVILSIVFMSGNVIEESKLYATLKKLGVDIEQPHELFGDVKKFVTGDLVRQGYIVLERQGMSDPPAYDVKWGARAKHETSKRNMLDFVSQIYGDENSVTRWTSQTKDVEDSEKPAVKDD